MAKSMESPTAKDKVMDSNMFNSQPRSTKLPTVTRDAEAIVSAADSITAKSQVVSSSMPTERPTERSKEEDTPVGRKGRGKVTMWTG